MKDMMIVSILEKSMIVIICNLELTNDEVIFKEYYMKTQKNKLKVSQIV